MVNAIKKSVQIELNDDFVVTVGIDQDADCVLSITDGNEKLLDVGVDSEELLAIADSIYELLGYQVEVVQDEDEDGDE